MLNFEVTNKKDDKKISIIVILVCILVSWLLTPPGNKFIQICFWGHNMQNFIAQTFDKERANTYKFHWKNAIYLVQLDNRTALYEMNKAMQLAPNYLTDKQFDVLYRERAKMKTVFKDYKGAMDDYLLVKELNYDDTLRLANISKFLGKKGMAVSYCNTLFDYELGKEVACDCLAEIYADAGKFNTSIKIYDFLIDKKNDNADYYIKRAFYKKRNGDFIGGEADIKTAQNINPEVELEFAVLSDVLLLKNTKFKEPFKS